MSRTTYDDRFQVKHFLGDVQSSRGTWFRVYDTGRSGWVLLRPIVDGRPGGVEAHGVDFVKRRSDFKRGFLPRAR